MWPFSDFQYSFRSSRSTADLLTAVSHRIARAFNRSGATRAVALDISDRVWHAGLLHKRKSYGISGQMFGVISSFLSNRRLPLVLDGKSAQEYPVNAGVPQGSIANIKKETLAHVFSCEFCEISKNTFFTEHLGTTFLVKTQIYYSVSNCQ